MNTVVSALIVGAVALAGSAALATETKNSPGANVTRQMPWQEEHPVYEFKPPMAATCGEFVKSENYYREYIVAYLEGAERHKRKTEVVGNSFVPLSVPQVMQECTAHPDKKVADVVGGMITARK